MGTRESIEVTVGIKCQLAVRLDDGLVTVASPFVLRGRKFQKDCAVTSPHGVKVKEWCFFLRRPGWCFDCTFGEGTYSMKWLSMLSLKDGAQQADYQRQ